MISTDAIKALLADDRIDEAIAAANEVCTSSTATNEDRAKAYYLRGNAYHRLGDWRMAQNSYLEAMDLDPNGPATMAYNHAQEILAFYNKDMYNP